MIKLIVTSSFTLILIVVLNTRIGTLPPLGKFLSPQTGFWQNAEPVNQDIKVDVKLPFTSKQGVQVLFDDRRVPHVFAEDIMDAYFVQGYLHARDRLFQMDMLTRAAGGRVSEVVGEKAFPFDRLQRRIGMTWAAEKTEQEILKDSVMKKICERYIGGVNSYIASLRYSQYPIEYKLLDFKPEPWSLLKSCLFLKYMAQDLALGEYDIQYTNAKAIMSQAMFEKLYPVVNDSLSPIISEYQLKAAKTKVVEPANKDKEYFNFKQTSMEGAMAQAIVPPVEPRAENIGSNNFAVSGNITKSHSPILANDPHLKLLLPSLWYEIQLKSSLSNAYGASFPGAPGVIIGFNDSCAWGFTNAGRDVIDYYAIQYSDDAHTAYNYNNKEQAFNYRVEPIHVRGQQTFYDTVKYTHFGPVMYDDKFHHKNANSHTNQMALAARWKAHDASNEIKIFLYLNLAQNVREYFGAIQHLKTPGQNVIFASKKNDIALTQQGEFPAKWYRQGDFIMPGYDSTYEWRNMIPFEENPYEVNPRKNYVSSANQNVLKQDYPYYVGNHFPIYRGLRINTKLANMKSVTVDSIKHLQTDNYNLFAATVLKNIFLKNTVQAQLDSMQQLQWHEVASWDYEEVADSKASVLYKLWWSAFENNIWKPHFPKQAFQDSVKLYIMPQASTLVQILLRNAKDELIDNPLTKEVETLEMQVTTAFKKATDSFNALNKKGSKEWTKLRATSINHILHIPAFSWENVAVNGNKDCLNATSKENGPSWRMVVHLTSDIEAYGIYPGGQSGNPGSKFYDNAITDWKDGKYYRLQFPKFPEDLLNTTGSILFH